MKKIGFNFWMTSLFALVIFPASAQGEGVITLISKEEMSKMEKREDQADGAQKTIMIEQAKLFEKDTNNSLLKKKKKSNNTIISRQNMVAPYVFK